VGLKVVVLLLLAPLVRVEVAPRVPQLAVRPGGIGTEAGTGIGIAAGAKGRRRGTQGGAGRALQGARGLAVSMEVRALLEGRM
jgi:hypothetical protein